MILLSRRYYYSSHRTKKGARFKRRILLTECSSKADVTRRASALNLMGAWEGLGACERACKMGWAFAIALHLRCLDIDGTFSYCIFFVLYKRQHFVKLQRAHKCKSACQREVCAVFLVASQVLSHCPLRTEYLSWKENCCALLPQVWLRVEISNVVHGGEKQWCKLNVEFSLYSVQRCQSVKK